MYGVDMHIVKVCLTTAWWPLAMIMLALYCISTLSLLWGGEKKEYCTHLNCVTSDLALHERSALQYTFLEGMISAQAYLLMLNMWLVQQYVLQFV